jgi:TRAP-type C4-dicarboxylate transport system permease small subunit
MVSALLIVAIIVFLVSFILLGIGIYKVYKENHPTTPSTSPSDLTGWGLTLAGVIGIFIGIILLVANYYQNKVKAANTKFTFVTNGEQPVVQKSVKVA